MEWEIRRDTAEGEGIETGPGMRPTTARIMGRQGSPETMLLQLLPDTEEAAVAHSKHDAASAEIDSFSNGPAPRPSNVLS